MKQPFQLVTPDRLQLREGGGCLSVFGLPFFAAGVFMCLTAAGIVPMQAESAYARPVLALLGIVFTVVGGALVFGRSWTTIDRAQLQVIKQRGLLMPMRGSTVSLRGYEAVTLSFVRGDSDSADSFPIALKAAAGPDLPLSNFSTYAEARACAKAIGDHLHLDLEDASTDHPVRLPAGQPDLSLQERLRTEGTPGEIARPHDARSRVTRGHGVTTVLIPVRPLSMLALLFMLIPVGISLIVVPSLREFFRRSQTPDPVAWFFLVFVGMFVFFPTMTLFNGFVRSRRGATIVEVSRQSLRIRERGAWMTRLVTSVEASDILDVDYGSRESTFASARRTAEQHVLRAHPTASTSMSPRVEGMLTALIRFGRGNGLTIKTRSGLIALGKGLEDAEVRYLHATIVRALID
jgi:multidrug transporter EmrE-like cation transporter